MSTVATDQDLLRSVPLFAQLSEADRIGLGALLKLRTFAAHEPIFWIGERGDDMFIVQLGKVRLSYTDEAGTDITLATVGPGAFFGELSLLDGGPRTATARAATDATVYSLDRQGFYSFIEKHPAAAVVMIATLGQRQRENLDKLRGVRNVNEEIEQKVTRLQRWVDKAAEVAASGRFLIVMLVLIVLWMIAQSLLVWRNPERNAIFYDDPPTFFWLGFMIALAGFLLTIFVLNSQKRQAERDRIRADYEYQVNLKSQLEVMELHQKMDKLAEMLLEKQGGEKR